MKQKIGVALIGAGRIGRIHANNLSYRIPQATLVAIADPLVEAAGRLASECRVPHVFDDPELPMRMDGVDAVLICSSTDTHASLIQTAAKYGKHVFCEKPLSLDLQSIDSILQCVNKAGVKLQVGFNRRFDPSFRRARELVAQGSIGVPQILRITSRDPRPPPIDYIKVSGGIFLDMTIHDFDMARFLLGSEVDQVFVFAGVLIDPDIGKAGDFDTAVTALRFSNGALGVIDNSRASAYGYDQRIEVFGSHGAVIVGNRSPDNTIVSDAGGIHAPKPYYFFLERYAESYYEEIKAFIHCICENTEPSVTGRDGKIPVVMGLAALTSAKEARPVSLTEIDPSWQMSKDA